MVSVGTDILDAVHRLRYGRSIKLGRNSQFFQELCAFQRVQKRAGVPVVSLPAIRSWLVSEKRSIPKRANAKRFLFEYLAWARAQGFLVLKASDRFEVVSQALEVYVEAKGDNAAGMDTSTISTLEPIVEQTFLSLIRTSDNNPRIVGNDLFHGADLGQAKDHSYFLLYRYSTKLRAILKSFLVCQTPEENVMNSYGFNHFIWGGSKPEFRQHIYRECEGIILRLARSYYFLGYNYVVPADKRRDPQRYQRLRVSAKASPNAMGLIAAEYDDIALRPGLFGAVTMSVAAATQPIVARAAFLHIGTRSRLGVEISDADIEPDEFYVKDLAADLRKVVELLQLKKCRQLGLELHHRSSRKDWTQKGSASLAREIINTIDNTPASEKQVAKKQLKGRGALEVFGHLRD
ncbi:hypothetical protein ACVWWO_003729 [Bradyrhizobium sp. F1.13.1]